MTPPRSVLVVVTRRIGDVLLATPLIRSLKRAWPGVEVDARVFSGTEGIIAANPDLRRVLTVPERPGFAQHLQLIFSVLRRYDMALSAVPSDRSTLYAYFAGRWRASPTRPTRKRWSKHSARGKILRQCRCSLHYWPTPGGT